MGFYQITLTVTLEQENAIIELFSDRKWLYQKQNQCTIEPCTQNSSAILDWESGVLANENNFTESTLQEQSDNLSNPIYIIKTEPSTESYGSGGKQNEEIDVTEDIVPTTSSIVPNTRQLMRVIDNDTKEIDASDKLDSLRRIVKPLFNKTHASNKTRRPRGRPKLKSCDDYTYSSMKKLKNDKTKSEDDTLILFTDVPVGSKTKTSSKTGNWHCDTCGYTWQKLKSFKKHVCKKICPYCSKVFPYGRTGAYNKHVQAHKNKINVKRVSIQTAGDKATVSQIQSKDAHNKASTSEQNGGKMAKLVSDAEQESPDNTIYSEKELSETLEKSIHDTVKTDIGQEKDSTESQSPTQTEYKLQDTQEEKSKLMNTDADEDFVNLHCNICKHTFTNEKVFEHHVKSNNCKRVCEYCGKVFLGCKKVGWYSRHLKGHLKQKDHQCNICGQFFYDNAYMVRHQKSAHAGERGLVCDLCGATFTWHAGLWHHMKNKHTENIQYPCSQCPRIYASEGGLYYHMKFKHGKGETPELACSTCGKISRGHIQLRNHEKSHRPKDFKCNQCQAAFRTMTYLKQHVKRHEKAYSHNCKLCDKKFYSLETLRQHMRTHTGEKPYACTLCDYRCAINANLKKHMRVHLKNV